MKGCDRPAFRDVVAVLNLRHVEQPKAEVATRRREVQTKTKKLAEEKAEMFLWWDHPGGRRDPEGGQSAQRTACPTRLFRASLSGPSVGGVESLP